MSHFQYHRPSTLEEVWQLRAECPEARFIAGGTDVMVAFYNRRDRPPALISLRGLKEFRGIEMEGDHPAGGARIGALTTIAEILDHPALSEIYPTLREAAHPFANVQIRNLATLGGNLCHASPAADMPPALLVLEARLHTIGPDGTRELSLEEFFVGPGETALQEGELLAEIVLDPPSPGTGSCYLRQGRVRMDLALVSVAVLIERDGDRCLRARVAAGAVAPRPVRLRAVEACLVGSHLGLDSDVLARARILAQEEIAPITDIRASEEYRRHLTGVLLQKAIDVAWKRGEK